MIKPGDKVLLARLPPWFDRLPDESRQVFAHFVGRAFRVEEIDEHGHLVLDVSATIDARFGGSMHDFRVEPALVLACAEIDEVILGVIELVASRLGPGGFQLVDHWRADRQAIGVASPGDAGVLVYVTVSPRSPDRLWFECELPRRDAPPGQAPYAVAERGEVARDELEDVIKRHFDRRRSGARA